MRLPKRDLKLGEEDPFHNITHRNDTVTIGSNSTFDFLKKEIKYIWVVNANGELVIGEDVFEDENYRGHPTLIDNKPARLGGELHWDEARKSWLLNLKSRAYSSHIRESSAQETNYIENLKDNVFKKLNNLTGVTKSDQPLYSQESSAKKNGLIPRT